MRGTSRSGGFVVLGAAAPRSTLRVMTFDEAVDIARELLALDFDVHLSADREGAGVSVVLWQLSAPKLAELARVAGEHGYELTAEQPGRIRLVAPSG